MADTTEVTLVPNVLRWARERANFTDQELADQLKTSPARIASWETDGRVSLTDIRRIADKTHTPYGYLFLSEPLVEKLPVPDFRVIQGATRDRPSPELLDVLHEAELRRSWYRGYMLAIGAEPIDWVGSLRITTSTTQAAERIRKRIGISIGERLSVKTWEEALSNDMDRIEDAGVLVMRTGIVGSNTSRLLSVDEFRGFAFADDVAPLIFINGRDAKAAQMFTLLHELCHLWIGRSAISNLSDTLPAKDNAERFCNNVAAELLVPEVAFRERLALEGPVNDAMIVRLTRAFKVSGLVIIRRLRDVGAISRERFKTLYDAEEEEYRKREGASGGNFYNTQQGRLSLTFAKALIRDTLAGNTTQRDAFRMLGIKTTKTFDEMARRYGVAG